ncbi:MAG: metallophosphoesterase [Candidatus Woesearchaeota archaeon]
MSQAELKKRIIKTLMSKDILVTEEILDRLDHVERLEDDDMISRLEVDNTLILDDDFYEKISYGNTQTKKSYDWNITELPTKSDDKDVATNESDNSADDESDEESKVKVIYSYKGTPKKREVSDFSQLFKRRYYAIMNILRGRKEMDNILSISRLSSKPQKESVAFVGMVSDKSLTANGNVILTIEDDTDLIKVVITKNNQELFKIANDIVFDEVIGITGMMGDNIVFANNIIFPDVPLSKELKKSPKDEYVIFISDLHFGSKYFMWEEWNKFVRWLSGEIGNDKHKEIINKIKYMVIGGDVVEGIGTYPGQENDLTTKDLYDQYDLFMNEFKKFPKDMKKIIIPGNHDAVRIADPQPPIPEKYMKEAYDMPEVYMLSSPSIVNIGACEGFDGLDLLLYHGYSFPYYAETIPSIRDNGGMKRADLISKFYLQRRHLGITHNALQYVPDSHDALFISQVPDVLVTGHIHRTVADMYRNVTILNCSTWLSMTDYQEKVGLEPQPARAILMSMKTRRIKILNFNKKDEENKDEENKEEETKRGGEA